MISFTLGCRKERGTGGGEAKEGGKKGKGGGRG